MESVILEIDALARLSGVNHREFKHVLLRAKPLQADNNDLKLVTPVISYKIPENYCLLITRLDCDAATTDDAAGAASRSQFNYLSGAKVGIFENEMPILDIEQENFKALSDTSLFLIVRGNLKIRMTDQDRLSFFNCKVSGFLVKNSIADFFLSNTTIMNYEVITEADQRNTVITTANVEARESAANKG